jgi:two-component system, NarL family, sensor histidine kinase UhpB
VRHSDARTVRFSLGSAEGAALMVVEDDGRGFTPSPGSEGSGIRGMRERALLVRAQLELDSAPGSGTAVRLRIPV